jgi:hydrogenase maturation factor
MVSHEGACKIWHMYQTKKSCGGSD